MTKFKVIIRTKFGELEVEGETVKELKDGLIEMGCSAEQARILLKAEL